MSIKKGADLTPAPFFIIMKKDLDLISGEFMDCLLPKNKQYLFHYFTTEVQQAFVRYYITFGEYRNFVQHSGILCRRRWIFQMLRRYRQLEALLQNSRKNMDFKMVAQIESGKYKYEYKLS